jgi:hypothetical protein
MTHDLNSSGISNQNAYGGGGVGIQMNAGYGGSPGMNAGYGGSPGMNVAYGNQGAYNTPGNMNMGVSAGPQGMNAKINF